MSYYNLLLGRRNELEQSLKKDSNCGITQRQLKRINTLIKEHRDMVASKVFNTLTNGA